MKLLFVEDEPESVEPIMELIREEGLAEENPPVKKFEEAVQAIRDIRPDVVILDLFEGIPSDQKNKGSGSLDFIWKEHFCPVIVYSAMPEETKDKEHPFIHRIKKGSGSENLLLKKLKEVEPQTEVLKDVERYVYETYSSAISEVAQYAFETCDGSEQRVDVLKRVARRRLAARADELSGTQDKLASWEQYIFPPISEEIRLGDILKEKTQNGNDAPEAFLIVLTPSCDLVRHNGKRKVDNVLASQCCSIAEGLKNAVNLGETIKKKNKNRIGSFLSQGHSNGIIPLPALKGRIPLMAANLRDLRLVPADTIVPPGPYETAKYIRIASLDSPFREMVSWAYLQVAGRPGLPDRDLAGWVEEIFEETAGKAENGK